MLAPDGGHGVLTLNFAVKAIDLVTGRSQPLASGGITHHTAIARGGKHIGIRSNPDLTDTNAHGSFELFLATCLSPGIFAGDFEDGSTSAWSSSLGGR